MQCKKILNITLEGDEKTINALEDEVRKTLEKQSVWFAKLKLENSYSVREVFESKKYTKT